MAYKSILESAIKFADLPKEIRLENDRITKLKIDRDRGFILALDMEFESNRQPLFRGHYNTANIGFMLIALSELLGVNPDGDSGDFLEEFEGIPLRVATTEGIGDTYVDHVWLGHFMKDQWVKASDIVMYGIDPQPKKQEDDKNSKENK